MSAAVATVLPVEDDPIVRADLSLVLEDAGYDVCAAARDGVEAVELAREHTPDLILLDLGLPKLDGVEVIRRVLAERDVPIVALTGRSQSLVEEALAAGAISFVRKPVSEGGIVHAVRDALAAWEWGRQEREASRAAIEAMLVSMGYPPDWAARLEARTYAKGRLWRIVR